MGFMTAKPQGSVMDERYLASIVAEARLDDWPLMRRTHNAILTSPDGLQIAKVHTSVERASMEVAVARHLMERGVSCARLLGHPHELVSIWERCDELTSIDLDQLAEAASQLHTQPLPRHPLNDWIAAAQERIVALESMTDDVDVVWLCARMREHLHVMERSSASHVLLHGDLAQSNMMTRAGQLCLIDWETARRGPREWDVACLRTASLRFGRLDKTSWERFIDQYQQRTGELNDDLLNTCAAFKEVRSASWAFLMGQSIPSMRREFEQRVASLRDGTAHIWSVPLHD